MSKMIQKLSRDRSQEISFDEAISTSTSQTGSIEHPIKNHIFYLVLLGLVLISLIGMWRVFQLGLVNGAFYSQKALNNIDKETPIIAPRGIITDRNGVPLLSNKLAFSVFLKISSMIKNDERGKVLDAFNDILGVAPDEISDKLADADLENTDNVLIAHDITREQNIKLASLNLTSILVQDDYKREYIGQAFSHVIGYVGLPNKSDILKNKNLDLADVLGRTGLENYYNSSLKGTNGSKIVYTNAKGETRETEKVQDPTPGHDLKTTIDADLQKYFYDRLIYNTNLRGQKAAVGIALNPKTGEVLSLISLPSYDANKIVNYVNAPFQPLFNRAISGVYGPASTIKPLHAVAGLREGVIDADLQIYSRGYIELPNVYFPDQPSRFVDHFCCGWLDMYSAIAASSNVYFYSIGGGLPPSESGILKGTNKIGGLGIDKLNEYWKIFGFDKSSGIDLPGESSAVLPTIAGREKRKNDNIWRVGDTYNVSIGQGDLSLNMMQLINYMSAIANKGKVYKPHLLAGEEPQVLMDLSEYSPEFKKVEKGMADSVYKPYGTSKSMADLPIKIAGKTGTAQTNNNAKTNALFVGYGPTDAEGGPDLIILVLIENAKEGSLNAIPIAKDVFNWYYTNRLAKPGL